MAVQIADCDSTCAFFFFRLTDGDVVVQILNVRLAADEMAPNNLLVGDRVCVVNSAIGDGVRGGNFGGVEGREPIIELSCCTSLVRVQLGLPGVEAELGTGGRFCFE